MLQQIQITLLNALHGHPDLSAGERLNDARIVRPPWRVVNRHSIYDFWVRYSAEMK